MNIKADFRHAGFPASPEFLLCKDFSAYPHSPFHHNAYCVKVQIPQNLYKIKIVNVSNIKFLIMICKTSLLLLNKINVAKLALIYGRK